ncbi:hypothetical protein L3X37_11160 [Sabulilitoribacter arenilitoris]|uniref:Glycerophosphoryl diester phosphodiesterase membrane domain-containing protein n=1 Tax=Wocania arenilitoris TaxID=2044858 RepID=A0AAE3EPS2_9FLAO|nr:hypothetical protein [Wocania arenilitoris]MCF7568916.1 hypothetical protein [Wocania arenilitoris]
MNTISSLLEKIERAKELDFGTIFSESIELFKKTWLQGFLLWLFTLIVTFPLIIALYAPLFTLIIAQQNNGEIDPEAFNGFFAGMSVLYIVFVIVGIFVLGTITSALYAAFFRIMKKLDYGQEVATSDFFYFVKSKYLSKIFILMLIAYVILIPSALLCYLPLLYTLVPLSFFAPIFAFNEELGVSDIVKASFKLGTKKWLIGLGLLIVSFLCYLVLGFITCSIGWLFLRPFMYHPTYLIYKKVVGFEETSAIEEIGTSTE